ncbi:MAG TPA: NDP-sugar synthase [Paenibacillaceae bacterium]
MKALLLAGGLGTRLRPLTEHLPKPMALVMGRPWLDHLIRHYRDQGISRFVIAVQHRKELIQAWVGDGSRYGVSVEYSEEKELLGTAGAVKNAEPLLGERFVVVNADIAHRIDLNAALHFHERHGGAATICLTRVEDPSSYGAVALGPQGEILDFVEKPGKDEAPSNLVNAGVYILERRVLDHIPAGHPVSIEKETFPLLIRLGCGVFGHPLDGYWMDMGTQERYRQLHWDVLDGRFPLECGWKKRGDKNIRMGEHVRIAADALLIPPVVLGDRVTIGGRSIIGPYAVIGSDCRIGRGVRIAHSILWDNCHVRTGAQLNRCILGFGMRVGPDILHEAVCYRTGEMPR